MGYRIQPKPHHHLHRTLVDSTTPAKVFIRNGVTSRLAFPCWYQEVHKAMPAHIHDWHRHNHEGWPSPSHPDHCCQMWIPDRHICSLGYHGECSPHCRHYIDMRGIMPIHLPEEGYTGYTVLIDGEVAENAVAYVDPQEDWVIRLDIVIAEEEALYEPHPHELSIFATASGQDDFQIRSDLAVKAKLIVLPVEIPESWIEPEADGTPNQS